MRLLQATTLAALLSAAIVSAVRPMDQVLGLPDTNALPSPWFSGYLKASPTKKLHYVFIASLTDPQNDPVVVWFNGGPGCSSLLALFQEHGPFVIDDGEYYIKNNPYPWNVRANMLYIESPAGVGYSIGVNPQDRIHNDMTQSRDAFAAIQDFYAGYSEFLNNPLYISGESYAGIYVPYLAW
jgi:cathepsin A (carboxypeptidase C)